MIFNTDDKLVESTDVILPRGSILLIAKKLGIARQSVSNCLRNKSGYSKETRAKVLKEAKLILQDAILNIEKHLHAA